MAITFTYKGSEALEMIKSHYPETWEQEINEGRSFIKSLMRMYNLSAFDAYQKYLKIGVSCDKAISTLAALHVMNQQMIIGDEILELQKDQQLYAAQSVALEGSQITSYEDKKILRQHYNEKKADLNNRIEALIKDYPVIGAEVVKVQLNIFEN